MRLALYSYWRSSSAWRVRIGLHLKGLPFEYRAVNLLEGAQFSAEHKARNPMSHVPVLEVEENGRTVHLAQSVAILEWLDERSPAPPLLPADPLDRARVRALVQLVNSSIQPYQNTAVQKWLRERHEGLEKAWVQHWIATGLAGLEKTVQAGAGKFCHGDAVTMADLYLVPQLYSGRRLGLDLSAYPTLLRIEAACHALPAFQKAAPEAQPDAAP
jgi:maleylpyruvate isomerase